MCFEAFRYVILRLLLEMGWGAGLRFTVLQQNDIRSLALGDNSDKFRKLSSWRGLFKMDGLYLKQL